jgi:hypothetical protein
MAPSTESLLAARPAAESGSLPERDGSPAPGGAVAESPAATAAPAATTTDPSAAQPSAEESRPAAGTLEAVAGQWRGVAVDSAGQRAGARAEVKEDGSFRLESGLTGEKTGTLRTQGDRGAFTTSSDATGTVRIDKDPAGSDVLTWEGVAPKPEPTPGSEPPKAPISVELERAK